MTIQNLLVEIRKLISKCKGSEKEMYEELMAEAEGWKARLEELEDES